MKVASMCAQGVSPSGPSIADLASEYQESPRATIISAA